MRFELNQNFSYNLLIDKFASDDAHISQSIFFFFNTNESLSYNNGWNIFFFFLRKCDLLKKKKIGVEITYNIILVENV